jgi:hypothetical protein
MFSGFGKPGILEIHCPAMPEIHEQETMVSNIIC